MPLSPGDKLGPYEIVSFIGAGGMGAVYKAFDPRLRREVAIKILSDEFAKDTDARRRFEREARAVASLHHPNICVLHDIGSHEDSCFLVLEFLEGETLAAQLRGGPLPATEAVPLAIAIAGALAQAHRNGVCHRDVKPANIILTKSGAKLLDFGLAKTVRLSPIGDSTLTADQVTEPGVIAGTAPYMSPEQIEGRDVDARSDIFSLGVVLYEMLTGERPFRGENLAQLTAAILEHNPPPVAESAALNRLIQRCLAKDREARWQNAQDLQEALQWTSEIVPAQPLEQPRVPIRVAAGVAILAVLSAFAYFAFRPPRQPLAPVVTRTSIQLPHYRLAGGPALAISPDGSMIAYLNASLGNEPPRLYIRRLDRFNPLVVPVEGDLASPFFSPDSQWLAFLETKSQTLKKIRVSGGPAVTVCALDS